ncbi:mitochondrial sodium/calcium exchanger protein [Rhinatrema bivittatum]|uniref:mitochondrial sodium/calcium exchanger protein n=1 Tax=Rhinatrema bivittatum TaxID=194408 RepID=UPI00112DEDDD|nr:mitochondrial sodium/calcium exchanger protein [Rhinatrema bivittatum]XP_029427708.1 mitochondrial sodium/calcium exchanger protein [Rhinatrema bivittatum]XP_029427709.1 mitochondrial sodium/calcium exchanger protein [Rhinatrema bivittatum]XP_029427710.1 mitochondrial sodium/calcium exchanger protein [Rhinatrema bivittatum]
MGRVWVLLGLCPAITVIHAWLTDVAVQPPTVLPQNFVSSGTWRNWNSSQGVGAVEDCQEVRNLNVSEQCSFVKNTPDCQAEDGFLHYLDGIFCIFAPFLMPLAIFLYALWLLYLFIILGLTAEKFFCPNLSAISTSLKLAHNVAGVTFLAFGNGAPDVFSAMAAFSDPRTAGLAIGALFGAGVFVTTVVAGGVCLVKPFTIASRPFLRDIIFYMVSIFLTFYFLYIGRIRLGEALGYLGIYVFYVLVVVLSTWIYRRRRNRAVASSDLGESESEEVMPAMVHSTDYDEEYLPLISYEKTTIQILVQSLNPVDYRKWRRKPWYWRLIKVLKIPIEVVLRLTVPVVDPDREDQNWKRPLNCLHLITSPLVCILTLKSGEYGLYKIDALFPVWAVVVLTGTFLAVVVFFTTKNEEPPKYFCVFSFLGFIVSAMWINAAATEVVNLLRTFGIIFRLSNTVLGLTLLAWGNSIGDFFSDITLARQGYPRMAISACFGGIIFNVLVGVGLGCLLQISRQQAALMLETDNLLVWILAGALGLSLVISFIFVPVQCFHLTRVYGICLILFYFLFLVVALLTEFKVIRLNRT